MTREDLVGYYMCRVRRGLTNCGHLAQRVIIIIVTNPLDTMTHVAFQASGFPKNRVVGRPASWTARGCAPLWLRN